MSIYSLLIVIHIVSATIWVGSFPADFILRKAIKTTDDFSQKSLLVKVWMRVLNLSGIVGLTGILSSGVLLSITYGYGFLDFTSSGNHWLYTKQLLTIAIIYILVKALIPTAKKISLAINVGDYGDNFTENIKKLDNIVNIQNILVLINFLLAILRKFMSF